MYSIFFYQAYKPFNLFFRFFLLQKKRQQEEKAKKVYNSGYEVFGEKKKEKKREEKKNYGVYEDASWCESTTLKNKTTFLTFLL